MAKTGGLHSDFTVDFVTLITIEQDAYDNIYIFFMSVLFTDKHVIFAFK